MDRPLITIGITSFNAEDTIEAAVSSALGQTWDNTDIVIVDDSSSDGTGTILRRLEKQYPALRVFYQSDNGGVAVSRNKIIKEARGDFIAFFDDDDESVPERLDNQFERIISYEKNFTKNVPIICHTAREQRYPNGKIHIERTVGVSDGQAPSGEQIAVRILTGKPCVNGFGSMATCSQMARTQLYRDMGGFDETLRRTEDTDFNIRIALADGHFVGIEEPLVIQRMTKALDKKLDDERQYAQMLLEKHKELIEKQLSYDFLWGWTQVRFYYLEGRKGLFVKSLLQSILSYPVLTLRKVMWSMPNLAFNFQQSRFHQS